jgi:hypothetical protein
MWSVEMLPWTVVFSGLECSEMRLIGKSTSINRFK